MAENNKVVGGSAWLFDKLTNYSLKIMGFVWLGPLRSQFQDCLEESNEWKTRELKQWKTGLNRILLSFVSFYWSFIQSFSKLAKPLTSILKTTPTQSAKNSPSDIAKDAEIFNNSNGDDNKIVERSRFSKKANIPIGYLTSLCSKKRRISLDSFWPLLKLLVKNIIGKAIKQSSY